MSPSSNNNHQPTSNDLIEKLTVINTGEEFEVFLGELSSAIEKMAYADVLRLRGEILTECDDLNFLSQIIDIFEGERHLRSIPSRPTRLARRKLPA